MLVDLRRDTITLPTEKMRERAFAAPLGDSVYGEDPLQNQLEEYAAHLLGKEASIFVPSGTMGNLVALLTHTQRGEEVILEENAHIRTSETGGIACVAGLMVRTLRGEDGLPEPQAIENAIRPDNIHYPRTSLICMESSHYRYGGIVPPLEKMRAVKALAERYNLSVHLDGARLFNSALYLGVEVRELAACADSVMISLSKGLAAPIGSVLAGSREFIARAKRFRKMLGGGMRQTGWLCACGLEALSPENIARLAEDHRNAKALAMGISQIPGIKVDLAKVHTNFVVAELEGDVSSETFLAKLKDKGVLTTRVDTKRVRFVTSRQVDENGIRYAICAVEEVMKEITD